jgi:segregation and condensation protein A
VTDDLPPEPSALPRERGEPAGSGALSVELPQFTGPLDLLLHLIRCNEIDIRDLPIVRITEQYNAYLDLMRELDLDIASEYVYMAALLIHIKSRMLLPQEAGAAAEDPRAGLIERLLEYQKYKRVAEGFHETDTLRAGLWPRPEVSVPRNPDGELELLEVSTIDLISVFRDVLERYRFAHPAALEIAPMRFSVREKMVHLVARLEERDGGLALLEFFGTLRYRAEAITVFIATLELIRLGIVRALQPRPFGEIHVTRTEAEFRAEEFQDDYRG